MDWRDYEQNVFEECQRIFRDSDIVKNVYIKGIYTNRKRQIDVLIKNTPIDGVLVDIAIDAKRYAIKVDVKAVESFIGMLKDVGAGKGIIVSEQGFTKAAINRAHLGENNIEVDILNLKGLQQFQATMAIPYDGSNAVLLQAPFGWVVDGTRREFAPATLYQRGYSLNDAGENKEWMYIQFWDKKDTVSSIESLIDLQNQNILEVDSNANLEIENVNDNIVLRKARISGYPTIEITGFRDLGKFIFFVVLFCPDNVISRNVNKLKYILNTIIPIDVKGVI